MARLVLAAWFLVLLTSTAAAAEFERTPSNHYILECEGDCRAAALETAIGAPGGISTDAEGNLYFSSQSVAFKLGRDGKLSRLAGRGVAGYAGDGGLAINALVDIPDEYPEMRNDPIDFGPLVGGLAVDVEGNVHLADAYNNRIRRIDRFGTISTVADAVGADIAVRWPQGVAIDAAGNLYYASAYGTISRRASDGTVVDLVAQNCGAYFRGQGACAPEQIALDSAGAVYFPDGYCRVRKWTPGIGVVTVAGDERPAGDWAFHCGNGVGGGPAIGTAMEMPYGVAIDRSDQLYIADTYNHCIRKVDAAGIITTIAGVCGVSSDDIPAGFGDGGQAVEAHLATPQGVAVDGDGNVYIADTGNFRIRRVARDGVITTVAGNGEPFAPLAVRGKDKASVAGSGESVAPSAIRGSDRTSW